MNVKEYDNHQALIFPASVGDYLSNDHLAHVVDEAVEEINLSAFYRKISSVGNPAYHPALMVKIWFYGYATRTYSSRKIEERLNTDVAFIYLSGMQKPDFRTISDFRKNNLNELRNSFVDILQICHRLGMIQLGNISIDSKVMKASASADRTYTEKELIEEQEELEKAIQKYLEKANQTDEEDDLKYGSDKRGNELPENICDKEQRLKRMKEVVEQLKQARQKIKESGKEKINLTDESAQFQKDKSRKIPGYRAHIAVDFKEQVIVANDVTNKQNDSTYLMTMIDKVLENVNRVEPEKFSKSEPEEPIRIPTDAGYSSSKNLAKLEEEGYRSKVDAYIPDASERNKRGTRRRKIDPRFDKSKFIYNRDDDSVLCPEGKKLHHIAKSIQREVLYDVYGNTTECKKCQHYGICTRSERGRYILISEYQSFIDKMRKKLSTEEGKKIYGTRKITAEPVFGNLSQNLGFREFLLRKLEKVKGEFSLMCSAHNLLKISGYLRKIGISLGEVLNSSRGIPAMNTS